MMCSLPYMFFCGRRVRLLSLCNQWILPACACTKAFFLRCMCVATASLALGLSAASTGSSANRVIVTAPSMEHAATCGCRLWLHFA